MRFILLLFPFLIFGQPHYIGDVYVSQEIQDAYEYVYNTLESGGVDMSRVSSHLKSVTYCDTYQITNNPLTLGYTTLNSNILKNDRIYINNRIKGDYFLVVVLYHEMTHLILHDIDCNRGLFLYSPTLKGDFSSKENVLNLGQNVKELIKFIKENQ